MPTVSTADTSLTTDAVTGSSVDARAGADANICNDTATAGVVVTRAATDASATTDAISTITLTLHPTGIPSGEMVSIHATVMLVGQSIFPAGIASAAALGSPTVGPGGARQILRPAGWADRGVVGTPAVSHDGPTTIYPVGIPA